MRVALHRHPGIAGIVEAATELLAAIPGVELVDLKQPAVGLQSFNVAVLPAFKRELQLNELQAASDAGVDALVAVYHSDHRDLCAHERDWPFRIINILEVIGESMGLHRHDRYKELKIMQDADQIVAECSDLIAQARARQATPATSSSRRMLGDQPLPLRQESAAERSRQDYRDQIRLCAVDQPGGETHRRAMRRHGFRDQRARADLGEIADRDVAEDGSARAQQRASRPIRGARLAEVPARPIVTTFG